MEDIYGHKIFKGEKYLAGNYLEKFDEKKSHVVCISYWKNILFAYILMRLIQGSWTKCWTL